MADIYISHHAQGDLKAVAEIESVSINPPWSYKAISDFAEYETNRILVAKISDIVVGYITYSVVLDEVQIANVAVHPDFRRQGIAEELLSHLDSLSKSSDMCIITLEVRQSNLPAIKLYEKCGYAEVGRRKNYYKNPTEDAILMNLTL